MAGETEAIGPEPTLGLNLDEVPECSPCEKGLMKLHFPESRLGQS